VIKQYVRALNISNSEIDLEVDEEDFLQFSILGQTDEHIVSCDNGLWRCTCEDYQYAKDKHLGSYTCKHILKAILFLKDKDNCSQKVLEDWF